MERTDHELVGKILISSRKLELLRTIYDHDGFLIGSTVTNKLSPGDHVMVFEVEEYDCYCKNKNNGMFACVAIAWTPRIAIRYISPDQKLCGLDIPFALLRMAFRCFEDMAPKTYAMSDIHWLKEKPFAPDGRVTRWFETDWTHLVD